VKNNKEPAMKLTRIKIEKLFGQFDYDIKLNQDEGITILTGPNGYGKTTILNIIWSLINQDFYYILSATFEQISFNLDDCQAIHVTKRIESVVKSTKNNRITAIYDGIIRVTNDGKTQTDYIPKLHFELLSKDTVCETLEFSGIRPEKNQTQILKKIFEPIRVYFIKDQRISKTVMEEKRGSNIHEKIERTKYVIGILSQELKGHIAEIRSKEDEKAKALNANYAERLFELKNAIPKPEFEERYKKLMFKYQMLQQYKIYKNNLTEAKYEDENRKALSLYLEDWEAKIAIYDELLAKIELFLSIMGDKGLSNKTFTVNAERGFCFTTADGEVLQLDKLSSGEQHQTILLYELLFNAPPNSLVLIDEPETSMHVAWQIEFLHDIEKIAKISNLSFIIATHSPDLINDKMDLCADLFENSRRNGNDGK
jgi:predicted ATP-binding protein involved in virulence